jgi:hypothetical protein
VAEAVNSASEERPEVARVAPPRASAHNARFVFAYLLIMVVFAGVVAMFAYMLGRSDSERWGPFKPKGEGLARATAIANYVAPRYRQGSAQIAVVQAQPPVAGNSVIDALAIARNPSQGIGGGYLSVEPATNTLLYVFCGRGQDCSIPGQPTVERGRLLRRQSLELALYTFKYLDDIDSVVTLLPPSGQNVVPAVWLRRRALRDQLDKPLERTLPGRPPFTTDNLVGAQKVEELTADRFYPSYFQPLPNGRLMLRLGGPPPEAQSDQQSGQSGGR